MDAGVVKEAICTSTKERLQRVLHVIDELGRKDRHVDKDIPAQPTKGSIYGQHTVVVACDDNLSVNCIMPALCSTKSREELIWASRHFVRVGDERVTWTCGVCPRHRAACDAAQSSFESDCGQGECVEL